VRALGASQTLIFMELLYNRVCGTVLITSWMPSRHLLPPTSKLVFVVLCLSKFPRSRLICPFVFGIWFMEWFRGYQLLHGHRPTANVWADYVLKFHSFQLSLYAQLVSLASCPQPQIGLSTYKIQGSKPAVSLKLFKTNCKRESAV